MGNVLGEEERQQVCALGRLGWPLLRIQQATGVRRETVGGYLRAAGIRVRGRGRPSEGPAKPAITGEVSTDLPTPSVVAVIPDPAGPVRPTRAPTASACEIYRAVSRGRNAMGIWQDLRGDN